MDLAGVSTPPAAERRYEAVVVAGAPGHWQELLPAIAALCREGALVAVVLSGANGASIELPDAVDVGCGTLLVAVQGRSGCLTVDGAGAWAGRRDAEAGDDALAWILAEFWTRGVAPGSVLVVAADAAPEALDRQMDARRRGELPLVVPEPGWAIATERFDADRRRVDGALFSLADGRVGSSGAPLAAPEDGARWVLAANVYNGVGPETRLLTAPVVLQLPFEMNAPGALRRVLDLRCGVLREEVSTTAGPLASVRFSSLARPGTVAVRAHCPVPCPGRGALVGPRDDPPKDTGSDGDISWMRVGGESGGIVAAVTDVDRGNVVDRIAVYHAEQGRLPEPGEAAVPLKEAASLGFDALLAEHARAWGERWEDADVVVDGDEDLQRAVRFALFHLMASVADTDESAVGARGLTGDGYRGHVFWDADTFTLPFLAATHPASARAMLEYRTRRLPAAMAAAREQHREGARFPWESARSGRDVTPVSARDRTGALVPIRTGQLEEHIVAEVAWAAACYLDWTGDDVFALGPGRELLVQTARYWASRVRRDGVTAHIYGVIGPDEYHEPVDDNAFTNVMARWNLRRAAEAVRAGSSTEVTAREVEGWLEIADALVDGYDPDTGVYEQFAGFHQLEPLLIAETAPHRPIAADLLLGTRRVNSAQVLKQADVLMLHHLIPDEVAPESLEPNLRFYEPRTAHGSSLSPGVHAALFARARNYERALEALRIASHMDLDDLTGSSGAGLHLATMGSLWQALAFGFAGLRPSAGRLRIDPRLPPAWARLEMRVRFRGSRVIVRLTHDGLAVTAEGPTVVEVGSTMFDAGVVPLELRRRGPRWEVVP